MEEEKLSAKDKLLTAHIAAKVGEHIVEKIEKEAKKQVKKENYILHHLKP